MDNAKFRRIDLASLLALFLLSLGNGHVLAAKLGDGWYLVSSPIVTANWEANSDNRWTVPVDGGVRRVLAASIPASISVSEVICTLYKIATPDADAVVSLRRCLADMKISRRDGASSPIILLPQDRQRGSMMASKMRRKTACASN